MVTYNVLPLPTRYTYLASDMKKTAEITVRYEFAPWIATCHDSLSFTISWSLLKFMFIESVILCNHFILCHLLLLLPSAVLSIRVFSNEPALPIRRPKYWRFSFSNNPSKEY